MVKNKIKIDHFPKSPGVYFFIDSTGLVLYVGKAKNLRSRIKSYFLKSLDRGPVIEQMVDLATNANYQQTESEIEAVFLEAELIKKLKPKYNTALKDDKSFSLIRVSKEDYPCVSLVRGKELDMNPVIRKKAQFFGPYPGGLALKKSIRYLRRIFPFRDCTERKFKEQERKKRPCLYGDIKLCPGPCCPKVSREDYLKNISYFKGFLRGNKIQIRKSLEREMKKASKEGEFERAASFRDKLSALNHMHEVAVGLRDDSFESSKILFNRIECYDISNIMGEYAVGAMSVITAGKSDNSEYRKFKIRTVNSANDLAMLEEIVRRRFKNGWQKPDLLVIDGGANQLNIAKKVIDGLKLSIPIVSIAKGTKRDKNEFHFSNQNIAKYIKKTPEAQKSIVIARNEAHRFAVQYYRLLHKKAMLS